jgi:sensor histidine kinase YesM
MNNQRSWINHPVSRILQHLVFWVVSFYVFLQIFKTGVKAEKIDYVYAVLFHLTLLPAVYLHLEWLLPKLANKKRWGIYVFIVVGLVTLSGWVNHEFFADWSKYVLPEYFFISYFRWWEIVLFFIIYISVTSLLKLSKSWFTVNELQVQLLETEKEKVQMELKALRSQINPHFFFNTLNNIYSMTLDRDERLPGTVLQLSELMRYFLYESKEDSVPLEKELNMLRDYIALQKIRSDEKLQVELSITGDTRDNKIAPFLLISFVENAFKHGVKGSSDDSFIRMNLHVDGKELNFRVENTKGELDDVEKPNGKGLGLENVRRRLHLIYPGRHSLDTQDDLRRFMVNLQIRL